jgi:hypothetical protein
MMLALAFPVNPVSVSGAKLCRNSGAADADVAVIVLIAITIARHEPIGLMRFIHSPSVRDGALAPKPDTTCSPRGDLLAGNIVA